MEKRRELLFVLSISTILVLAGFAANEKAYAGNTIIPTGPFGDYTCWASVEFGNPTIAPLTIIDQFNTEPPIFNDEWERAEYCTATTKSIDGEEFSSPFEPDLNQHYQGWFYPDNVPNDGTGQFVTITVDQFGYQFDTTLGELDQILVPANKILQSEELVEAANLEQHWNCYNIQGSPPPIGIVDPLVTQHGSIFLVTVGDPFLFCLPMIKDHNQNLFGELLDEHMVCYDITSEQNPIGVESLPTALADQLTDFDPIDISYDTGNFARALEKLCVPALKSFPAIGGISIPMDTSALLLAGVSSISMWMIPVVIAGVGIGVFVIKRRK